MSVNDETKNLEEEVVVNECEETTELVEVDKEAKKAKMAKTGKKVLKVAGVVGIGVLGYLLGTKAGRKSKSEYNDSEYEVVESDEE